VINLINSIYYIVFFIVSLLILLKTIGYGMYEIKVEKNLIGGICVIVFSISIIIFANIMLWLS